MTKESLNQKSLQDGGISRLTKLDAILALQSSIQRKPEIAPPQSRYARWINLVIEEFNDFFLVLSSSPSWNNVTTPPSSGRLWFTGLLNGTTSKNRLELTIFALSAFLFVAWMMQVALRTAAMWNWVNLNAGADGIFTFLTALVGTGLCLIRGFRLLYTALPAWREDRQILKYQNKPENKKALEEYKKLFKKQEDGTPTLDALYGLKLVENMPNKNELIKLLKETHLKGCYLVIRDGTKVKGMWYVNLESLNGQDDIQKHQIRDLESAEGPCCVDRYILTSNASDDMQYLSQEALDRLHSETGRGPVSNAWVEPLLWGITLLVIGIILAGFYFFKATIETLHPLAGLVLNITMNELNSLPLVLDVLIQLGIASHRQEFQNWNWNKTIKWGMLTVKLLAALSLSVLYAFPVLHVASFALVCTALFINLVFQAYQKYRELPAWKDLLTSQVTKDDNSGSASEQEPAQDPSPLSLRLYSHGDSLKKTDPTNPNENKPTSSEDRSRPKKEVNKFKS